MKKTEKKRIKSILKELYSALKLRTQDGFKIDYKMNDGQADISGHFENTEDITKSIFLWEDRLKNL